MLKPDIQLHPSKILFVLITSLYLGACLCVLFLQFSIWLAVSIIGFLIGSYCFTLRRYVLLKSRNSIIKFWHHEQKIWYLQNRAGEIMPMRVRENSFISRYLIILNFKTPIVICRDAVKASKLRILRVCLLQG